MKKISEYCYCFFALILHPACFSHLDFALQHHDNQNIMHLIPNMYIWQLTFDLNLSTFLGISLEILFLSCSDENADVRLNTEECLNRLIKGLYETNINRVLVELFKEIKRVEYIVFYCLWYRII